MDDNAAVCESLVLLLQSEGIPAESHLGGSAVLTRLMNGETPRVLLMDVKMPYNGMVLLDAILAHKDWKFPIIVLTGYENNLDPKHVHQVEAVLSKTVDPNELIREVRRVMNGESAPPMTPLVVPQPRGTI